MGLQPLETQLVNYPERSTHNYKTLLAESYGTRNAVTPEVVTAITRNGGFPFHDTLAAITQGLRNAIDSGKSSKDIRNFFASIDTKKLPAARPLVQACFPFEEIPAPSRARDLTEFAHASIYEYCLAKEYREPLFKTDAANMRWMLSRAMQPVAQPDYFVKHRKNPNALHIRWADGLYVWKRIPGPSFEEHVADLQLKKMGIHGKNMIQDIVKKITSSSVAHLSGPRVPPKETRVAQEVVEALPRLIYVCIFINLNLQGL